jgi:protein tyrosine phosphatase (PTP) superfamily phosphohydrolase (DUF442 family)
VPLSAHAASIPCLRCLGRRLEPSAQRSARRWAVASLALAAAAALALFWLVVKPVTLETGTLGINYVEVSTRIGTAGMPTRKQIGRMAEVGSQVVINLAPSDAMGSHDDEAALVAAQGMAYEHLPVDFANPTAADYVQFELLMKKHDDRRVLVHCQIALRAPVFTYLYRVLELGEDPDLAYEAVQRVWQPSHQWRALIRELHAARGRPLPFALESAA